ncbi:tetratricopeptide repeat protein [Rhodopirellula sp. MGV]|uniref:tetratricopeptide repeat protein n=1 Tax=Rhodopirellula sp. MGV TaxID=2023130 RepID=UPI000B9600B2|nr:tetratricopeptide repeat protein [Rhodopirellula sp. MGV]OYP37468.1 hypothetical protein CGZ80_04890 [Rhodopirellula sp. MGV]PNY37871.1 tetratricopeptide repeat protein [Rhodopirellula baltica]
MKTQKRDVKTSILLAGMGLILLVGAAHSSGLGGAFVFDDKSQIVENSSLNGLPSLSQLAQPRAVTYLTLRINRWIGGTDPIGYHIFNLLIHVLSTVVLWAVLFEVLSRLQSAFAKSSEDGVRGSPVDDCGNTLWTSYAIALIWGLHPITTQAVAYSIQRAESLWSLFFLAGWWLYLKADERRVWMAASILFFWLAIGSKEPAVVALVALPILDHLISPLTLREWLRQRWRYFAILVAPVVIGGVFVVGPLLWVADDSASSGFAIEHLTPLQYWLTQSEATLLYVRLIFFPVGQNFDYLWPPEANPVVILVANAIVLGALGVSLTAWWRKRWWSVFPLVFFLCIATTAIVPLLDIVVEHRVYLASAWLIAWAVLAICRFFQIGIKQLRIPVSIVAVLLGVLTYQRSAIYTSPESLWQDVAAKAPWNYRALFNLGGHSLEDEDPEQALEYFKRALDAEGLVWQPDYEKANVLSGYAGALSATGQWEAAVESAEQAIALTPGGSEHLIRLADVHLEHGHWGEAENALKMAIQNRPTRSQLYLHLTTVLAAQKRFGEASQWMETAFERIQPPNEAMRLRQAQLAWMEGRATEAKKTFDSMRQIDAVKESLRQLSRWLMEASRVDESREILATIGESLDNNFDVIVQQYKLAIERGNLPEASAIIQRQLDLSEGEQQQYWSVEAALLVARQGELQKGLAGLMKLSQAGIADQHLFAAIGDVNRWIGNTETAIDYYQKALKQGTPSSATLNNLGALISATDPSEAERLLRRAIEIDRSNFNAWHSLGNALVRQGRNDEARQCYQNALAVRPGFQPSETMLKQLSKVSVRSGD